MANILENVGERTIEHLDYVGSLNIQWWATMRAMALALPFVGNRYRRRTAVRQMLEIGIDAIPMVSLMAICTGFIFAVQGASELRRFGALRYVVDLVAVGFTRELGPLMTAIAVSGRSGSAFAAEIGTMKVTEELEEQPCDLIVRQNHGQRCPLCCLSHVCDRIAVGELPAASVTEKRAQDVPDLRLRAAFQRQRCQPRFDSHSFGFP